MYSKLEFHLQSLLTSYCSLNLKWTSTPKKRYYIKNDYCLNSRQINLSILLKIKYAMTLIMSIAPLDLRPFNVFKFTEQNQKIKN